MESQKNQELVEVRPRIEYLSAEWLKICFIFDGDIVLEECSSLKEAQQWCIRKILKRKIGEDRWLYLAKDADGNWWQYMPCILLEDLCVGYPKGNRVWIWNEVPYEVSFLPDGSNKEIINHSSGE